MLLIDIKMPNGCHDCAAMRCSKCIISDSINIMDYQVNRTRPNWCPIIDQVSDVEELKHEDQCEG